MLKQKQYGRIKAGWFVFHLFYFLVFIPFVLSAQPFSIDSGMNITHSPGNDLFPKWSPDGNKLLYQSDRNGNWDIFIYDFLSDTSFQLTSSPTNEQHPVWFDKARRVVFDSDRNGQEKLYVLDTATKEIKLLFNRDIQCREASFGENDNLVFFAGFDEHVKKWEIFSYEFYYKNLNRLYGKSGVNCFPEVSPEGGNIIFLNYESDLSRSEMVMINWYGNVIRVFDKFYFLDPSFAVNGHKIYFVSNKDNPQGEVYSFRTDGSHPERLTNDNYFVRCPVVSSDGSMVALSVKTDSIFDIFIIPLEEY